MVGLISSLAVARAVANGFTAPTALVFLLAFQLTALVALVCFQWVTFRLARWPMVGPISNLAVARAVADGFTAPTEPVFLLAFPLTALVAFVYVQWGIFRLARWPMVSPISSLAVARAVADGFTAPTELVFLLAFQLTALVAFVWVRASGNLPLTFLHSYE